jgi:hypothetical protein
MSRTLSSMDLMERSSLFARVLFSFSIVACHLRSISVSLRLVKRCDLRREGRLVRWWCRLISLLTGRPFCGPPSAGLTMRHRWRAMMLLSSISVAILSAVGGPVSISPSISVAISGLIVVQDPLLSRAGYEFLLSLGLQ